MSFEKLEYIGAIGNAPECSEVREFHSNLLLHHLAALEQLNVYHRAFPWKLLGCLDPTSWDRILGEMEEQWSFVTGVCDVLRPNQNLFNEMAVTRHQCYRDLMIKAEYLGSKLVKHFLIFARDVTEKGWICSFGMKMPIIMIQTCLLDAAWIILRHFRFDRSRMGTPEALPFEEGVKAVCGLQGGDSPNSLLSSLPCELAFSSMRDSAKRHAKQERQSPPALHCVAWKSASRHPCGSIALELEAQDWADPLSQKYVKQHVHSALRCTDKELGVSCEGLTRHRVNKVSTRSLTFIVRAFPCWGPLHPSTLSLLVKMKIAGLKSFNSSPTFGCPSSLVVCSNLCRKAWDSAGQSLALDKFVC